MKSILLIAVLVVAIASCDTPQTTTGSGTDTTTNVTADTTTNKPDSTRQ